MSVRNSLGAAVVGAALAITPLYAGSAQAQDGTLETLIGSLAETAPQLQLDTIRDACQITTESRTNSDLRSEWFYTANAPLCKVEPGDVSQALWLYSIFGISILLAGVWYQRGLP